MDMGNDIITTDAETPDVVVAKFGIMRTVNDSGACASAPHPQQGRVREMVFDSDRPCSRVQ